jgi:HK97 family phage portal protein
MEYKQSAFTPADSQLIEGRQFGVAEIGRLFGIPPLLLGAADSSTRQTAEAAIRQFVTSCLAAWAEKIETALSRALFAPGSGLVLKLDLDELLRGDLLQRFQSYQIGINSQFLTPNECRRAEGRGPIAGGDVVVKMPGQGAPAAPTGAGV